MTYSEIYIQFRKTHPTIEVSDYRPYPLADSAIIIWSPNKKELKETAYSYDEKTGTFNEIQNPVSYNDILNGRR